MYAPKTNRFYSETFYVTPKACTLLAFAKIRSTTVGINARTSVTADEEGVCRLSVFNGGTMQRVDVDQAIAMRKSGMTLDQIGNHFGFTREWARKLVGHIKRIPRCRKCKKPCDAEKCESCSRSKWQIALENSYTVSKSGCWEWQGAINNQGYGLLATPFTRLAHRAAYFTKFPQADRSLCVCHKCDNPRCINTDHHFLGTQADNLNDMRQKGRSRAKQLSADQKAVIIELGKSKLLLKEICSKLGHSCCTVRKVLRDAQLRVPRKRTKITKQMRLQWHQLRSRGVLVKAIAAEFNVDLSIVSVELNHPTV